MQNPLTLGKGWLLSLALPTKITQTTVTARSGQSGKSTIVKQMKIIHGFLAEVRIGQIYRNLLESAQDIVFAIHKLSIEPADVQNRVCYLPCSATYAHLHCSQHHRQPQSKLYTVGWTSPPLIRTSACPSNSPGPSTSCGATR